MGGSVITICEIDAGHGSQWRWLCDECRDVARGMVKRGKWIAFKDTGKAPADAKAPCDRCEKGANQ